MDLANQQGALMVGTGDLSEIALGWSTFNGDHISFYNVNAGVPKTLLLQVLAWAGGELLGKEGKVLAERIANASISPELLPLQGAEHSQQSTEESIGPYLLHDFFLYHMLVLRQNPQEIFQYASLVFEEREPAEILKWLRVFYKRFFAAQFKRSASSDGPQVTEVSLSPRGGWVMPSDAVSALWLNQVDNLIQGLN
jgi:NAD+ synthase (glutamine-hydrolysing)